jgi:small-conductance mechanosensitive channel/CRP-like cAMP-binding protein
MNEVLAMLWRGPVPWAGGAALLLAALVAGRMAGGPTAARRSLWLLALCLLLDGVAALANVRGMQDAGGGLHQLAVLGLGAVLIHLGGLVVFRILLPALHQSPPRILQDVAVLCAYLVWGMVRLSALGVELTSLVATSAVITAVLAFALQDTLGNILGGLALQLDDSFEIGDWLRLDDISGRVEQIQWRFTALRTRNGETVVIPNAQLMKGKFSVIGGGMPGAATWRRWVWFNLGDDVNPSLVIAAAERALADADIANVARQPPPSCVAMEFNAGAVRYALRYWLCDPRDDDTTDSAVRVHLLAALQRQGWSLALPDQALHLVQDGSAERQAVRQQELARRLQVLAAIDLFAALQPAERQHIAERLVSAPFVRGDVVTHQGAVAHWLYILAQGEADVFLELPAGQRRLLTRLPQGSIFGEMGLLTGAPRSATVVAASDVVCYRLDKAGFEGLIHARPAIAESLSRVLAQRQHQNEALQHELRKTPGEAEKAGLVAQIMERMHDFFGLR